MPSFARRSAPPARVLPAGIFVGDVADRGRAALVAFLRLAARGAAVDHTALTEWLFGPYLDAISIGHESIDATTPTFVLENDGEGIGAAEAVAHAAMGIEGLLRAFHAAPDLSVSGKLVDSGVVEPIIDERSARGYAPLAGGELDLGVRVLSITAAELLTRPERLFNDLVVTDTSVELAERTLASGVGFKSRQTMPWRPVAEQREQEASSTRERMPSLADLVAEAEAGPPSDENDENDENDDV